MGWLGRNKRDESAEAPTRAGASDPRRPLKGRIAASGCLVCPICGGESAQQAAELRRWMREQRLGSLACGGCGAFLTAG